MILPLVLRLSFRGMADPPYDKISVCKIVQQIRLLYVFYLIIPEENDRDKLFDRNLQETYYIITGTHILQSVDKYKA